jgi:hypothetical protein
VTWPGAQYGDDDDITFTIGNPLRYSDPTGQCPWCVVLIVYELVEVGMSLYDAYDTYETVSNDCTSEGEKLAAAGLFTLGILAPGAGYSRLDNAVDAIDNISDTRRAATASGRSDLHSRQTRLEKTRS